MYKKMQIHKGAFTLLECLIALTIAGMLFLFVLPSLRELLVKNRVIANTDRIVVSLRFARTAALERAEKITFCKSRDHKHCCSDCVWADGKIIIDCAKRVLLVADPTPSGDKLIWRGNLGLNDVLEFTPLGTTAGQQGSFFYCPKGMKQYNRAVIINLKGRVYVSDKTAQGEDITCSE